MRDPPICSVLCVSNPPSDFLTFPWNPSELMALLDDYELEVEDTGTSLTYYSSYRTDETCMRPDLYQPVLFTARKRRREAG